MTKILGLSGSLRTNSINTALLRAAQSVAGESLEFEVATVHGVPLYDGDEEQQHGTPSAVRSLEERILAADGLLLVTPEYNGGIPGVFKNTIDWLSRPTPGMPDVFRNRPVAVVGASPGGFGTTLAQAHWLPVLRTLGVRQWNGGRLLVSRAGSVFDADGKLTDDTVLRQLSNFIHGFADFARA